MGTYPYSSRERLARLALEGSADDVLGAEADRRLNAAACCRESILVVVAKQGQVDRLGHGPITSVVGMHVVAAVVRRQHA